ncbi:hypothetical protein [Phytohabitans kaempferiae]|uniref:Uncharacterized protein n=1 Tax=Phytohabitans kaempferiae TaxID=1620943 RepID=A0ABV6MCZ2_9ACTN
MTYRRSTRVWLAGLLAVLVTAGVLAPAPAAVAASYPQYANRGAIPLTATTTAGGETARMPDGTYRTWLAVSGLPAAGTPAYLAEVDPFTRTVVRKFTMPDAQGAWGVSVASNGDVFVATYGKGALFRLPWGGDQIQNLGAPTQYTSFLWEGDTDDQGRLYVGTTEGFAPGTLPPGRLVGWDPATNAFRDYGTFGDRYTYVRSVEYADGQLYVGLGPVTAFYKVDPVTGEKTELPLPPGMALDKYTYQLDDAAGFLYVMFAGGVEASSGWVWDLKAGGWARRASLGDYRGQSVSSADRAGRVYMVRNGELTEYHPRSGHFRSTGFAGNVDLGGLSAAKGMERIVDPSTGHELIVAGQPAGELMVYDVQTRTGTLDRIAGLTGTATAPRSLAVGPDGRVYGGGYFSGGFVAWDPRTGEWTTYDFRHQVEGMATHNGILYLGVYPNAEIWAYDPAIPFGDNNPRKLFDMKAQGQERPWTLTSAGDYLAVGTSPKNSQTDGALALYNPADGSHEVFHGIAGDQQVSALTYRDGVLYGGSLGCCPAKKEGKVFAFDVASRTKLWETVPLAGEQGVNALAFDGQGRLFGITAGKAFELDPATREVLRSVEYRAYPWPTITNFQPRAVNLVYDPHDGYLYGTAIGYQMRIDPDTLVNTGGNVRGSLFAADPSGPKYMLQSTLLLEARWYDWPPAG